MTTTKIFLTNLRKYNDGECVLDCGKWIELPMDSDDLQAEIDEICGDDEYFITDYEAYWGINEYDNPFEVNELAERIDALDKWDEEKLEALVEEGGYDVEEALDMLDDVIVYSDCTTMSEVAEQLADETGLLDHIPDNLKYYFDFEAYGRDLEIEGTFLYHNGSYYEVIR